MPQRLVIVESPTKARTIKRFLGKDFAVEASMGHVRDLPESKLGVDPEDNFAPQYEVPEGKKGVIKKLQDLLNKSDELWIATDEDREGEAIGWHLVETLKRKNNQPIRRIVFHEITEEAIKAAAEHPREIDLKLVDAQQARRILDRLVGYTLSPFLWKKVYRGLSAGRVQSVAVRIIVDRERQIKAFNPVEYWTIEAELETQKKEVFIAKLSQKDGKKFIPSSAAQSQAVVEAVTGKPFTVAEIEEKELERSPAPPFTTSTLQQEAGRKLGFSVKQTMMVAQQLYEGMDVGPGSGHTGLITYMRTDSVNLSEKALTDAKASIEKLYGREYVLSEPRKYKTKSKGAQEAHEAIRPTEISRTPESLVDVLDHQQLKLYTLIWNRTVATQMAAAQLKRVGADIAVANYTFRATGQTVLFDGFLRLYREDRDEPEAGKPEEEDDNEKLLPPLSQGQSLESLGINPEQHFTKPPPRYTEASLVKKLEEEGIGRPSTYAPTISTIQQRGYIKKEGRQLIPEDVAFTVTDLLTEHFSDIVSLSFTAQMEQSLDDIAEGNKEWQKFLSSFYKPYKAHLDQKGKEITRDDVLKERNLGNDPKTGLPVLVRTGRFGPYVQLGHAEDLPAPEVSTDAVEEGVKKGTRAKGTKTKGAKKAPKVKKPKPKSASIPKHMSKDEITLEQALGLLSFPRMLGIHDGNPMEVNVGRFGPYLRCGVATVSIKEGDPVTITLEEAITMLANAKELRAKAAEPLRTLGTDPATGSPILVKTGRYGPYVTDGKTNVSVPKRFTPETITTEEAAEILAKKRAAPPRKWGGKKK
ncbi:DNA topoisomerase I [Candidatus Peribacteria bacterium RIFCSPHIGHO2_01_FULL_55_13]|nr:MAG: DNA topoisomerase I [Candidatus Peribacteria bacterium RIFCSPHIGHO2_01_FULL_55_13]OGJ65966.1 MAG: DNA topoisomerase I [Candidatus Peribacteria bacterium RIFCSPHIGHO2_12_FULL_55_11]